MYNYVLKNSSHHPQKWIIRFHSNGIVNPIRKLHNHANAIYFIFLEDTTYLALAQSGWRGFISGPPTVWLKSISPGDGEDQITCGSTQPQKKCSRSVGCPLSHTSILASGGRPLCTVGKRRRGSALWQWWWEQKMCLGNKDADGAGE
jgi:hypothetical protein